jgi:hypothetical protein
MGEIEAGMHRVRNNPLVVDRETRNRLTRNAVWCRRFFVPLLRPADIRRYVPEQPARFVIQVPDLQKNRKCRALAQYLERAGAMESMDAYRDALKNEPEGSQTCPAEKKEPEQRLPKIIFSPYQHSPAFCFDPRGSFAITGSLVAIPRNDPYLAAVLNSTLGRFIIMHTCPVTDRGYHTGPAALGKFPVQVPDFDKLADKKRHHTIVALVTQIVSLQEYLPQAKTDQERRLVQQEIDATDVRIDALVYELYGLTNEEIAVVEATMGN